MSKTHNEMTKHYWMVLMNIKDSQEVKMIKQFYITFPKVHKILTKKKENG